jgi:hypothetical protein
VIRGNLPSFPFSILATSPDPQPRTKDDDEEEYEEDDDDDNENETLARYNLAPSASGRMTGVNETVRWLSIQR